ncbi:hypothetical protein L6452_34446 [Arctium lappa]|uniref:Uncharacterized protein n=1 Tax=Arctium lappa TaxID=4217 RepID=A0ACB8YJT4_ARCLA|nr:hypothetical protein L6452_34446 [Arctium lappa]
MDAIDATNGLEQNESIMQVSQVAVEEQGETNDVMMEESATDESMEEAAIASVAQPVDKGKQVEGTSGKDKVVVDHPPFEDTNKASRDADS